MKLSKLVLKNYPPFKDEKPLEFSDRVTVIAGVNGHGKTAILDALSILISRLLPQISPAVGGCKPIPVADIYHGEASLEMSLSAKCAGYPVTLSLARGKNNQRVRAAGLSRANKKVIREEYEADSRQAGGSAPIAVYYSTDRAGFRLPRRSPKVASRGQSAAYLGALVSQRIDYSDLIGRLAVSVALDAERRQRNPYYLGARAVDAINRVMAVFLDGFDGLRVVDNPIRLLVNKNGIPLGVPQLSDGERSFVAILTDLCRRLTLANPGLPDPLQGKGVVLIDELELHLHPTWQREIVEKLRTTFPGLQFIGTTHSPFIVQSLRPGELRSLDPEEFGEYAGKSIGDIAEDVMGVEMPQKDDRYIKMLDVARKYYKALNLGARAKGEKLAELKRQLDELSAAYSDDPAYVAYLQFQRGRVLGTVQ